MATVTFEIVENKAPQVIAALKLFKGVSKIKLVPREKNDEPDECPICKAHNYTLAPEVAAELLRTIEEDDFTHCDDFEDFKKKVLA